MRTLYDPGSILLATTAAFQFASGIASAASIRAQGAAQAADLEAQAGQERIATARELRDLKKERGRTLARTRAALAAQGGDLSSGTPLELLKSQASEYAVKETRVKQDSRATQEFLRTRRRNVQTMADFRSDVAIFGGAANAGTTLLARRPKVTADG